MLTVSNPLEPSCRRSPSKHSGSNNSSVRDLQEPLVHWKTARPPEKSNTCSSYSQMLTMPPRCNRHRSVINPPRCARRSPDQWSLRSSLTPHQRPLDHLVRIPLQLRP